MPNEHNEGEYFDELYMPLDTPMEKQVARQIFGRIEVKKVSTIPGVNMNNAPSNPKRTEYPRALYNKKGEMKVVKNVDELDAARKIGYMTGKERATKGRPTIIDEMITEKLQEIADLIAEHEKLTGKLYESSLEKMLGCIVVEKKEEE